MGTLNTHQIRSFSIKSVRHGRTLAPKLFVCFLLSVAPIETFSMNAATTDQNAVSSKQPNEIQPTNEFGVRTQKTTYSCGADRLILCKIRWSPGQPRIRIARCPTGRDPTGVQNSFVKQRQNVSIELKQQQKEAQSVQVYHRRPSTTSQCNIRRCTNLWETESKKNSRETYNPIRNSRFFGTCVCCVCDVCLGDVKRRSGKRRKKMQHTSMTFAETNPVRLARLSEQSAHTEPYQLYRLLRHHEHNRDKHNKKKSKLNWTSLAGWVVVYDG